MLFSPRIISLVCSKVILLNVKFFYRQIITPDISLGAHDYYTISFLMDAISFIIIAVGHQSFGVCFVCRLIFTFTISAYWGEPE